jgi:small subunit ribosomal protein S6
MERHYETICIIKPDIGDEAVQGIVKKATGSLEKGGAELCKVDEWGRRKLAYPIEKKNEGFYVLLDYTSTPEVNKELERSFKLNEDVLRYQTVRIEAPAVVEAASEEDVAVEAASEDVAVEAASEDVAVEAASEDVAAKAASEDVAAKAASEDAAAKAASAEGTAGPVEAVSDDKGGEDE